MRFHHLFAGVGRLAGGALMVLMMITVVDVFMRYVFRNPIAGGLELVELAMVCLSAAALAWRAYDAGHIKVDLFVGRLSPRGQKAFDGLSYGLALVVALLVATQSVRQALFAHRLNASTSTLHIPQWPFYLVLAAGYTLFFLAVAGLISRLGKGADQ